MKTKNLEMTVIDHIPKLILYLHYFGLMLLK
jgi:hypothetical protein